MAERIGKQLKIKPKSIRQQTDRPVFYHRCGSHALGVSLYRQQAAMLPLFRMAAVTAVACPRLGTLDRLLLRRIGR